MADLKKIKIIIRPCWFLQHVTISRKLEHLEENEFEQRIIIFNCSIFTSYVDICGFIIGHRPYTSVCVHICMCDLKDSDSFYELTVLMFPGAHRLPLCPRSPCTVFFSGILSPAYLSEVILTFEFQRCLIGFDWRLALPVSLMSVCGLSAC